VEPMEIESPPGLRSGSRRLCIVSRNGLRAGVFVEALRTALGPHDELEIVVDRRRGWSSVQPPSIDRRRYRRPDPWLERDGFALVPATYSAAGSYRPPLRALGVAPGERFSPADAESDERELERIPLVKRRRQRIWTAPRLIVPVLLGVIVGVSLVHFVLSPAMKTPTSQVRADAKLLPADAGAAASATASADTKPSANHANEARTVAPVSTAGETPASEPPSSTSVQTVTEPSSASPERRASPRTVRTGPEAGRQREATPSPRGAPHPSAVDPAPTRMAAWPTTSEFARLPSVEMSRVSAPVAGGDETYAIRLSDTAGRPLAGAEVSLLIRTEDGALLDLPVASGSEPGIYRATVPPIGPAAVAFRVRVATSDTRVELPVTPPW
jgi:hypothetical protein